MRFSITGGSDVTGSAERAPFVARPVDRLAVGEITVANSEHRGGNGPAVPVDAGAPSASVSQAVAVSSTAAHTSAAAGLLTPAFHSPSYAPLPAPAA